MLSLNVTRSYSASVSKCLGLVARAGVSPKTTPKLDPPPLCTLYRCIGAV